MTPYRTRELDSMLQLVNEAEAVLRSSTTPLAEFGRLLDESWRIKRTLTDQISTPIIDEIYKAGLDAGAIGGKLLGAGGGGFMLFFVSPERRHAVKMRLQKLLCVPFSFSTKGSELVVYETNGALHRQSLALDVV